MNHIRYLKRPEIDEQKWNALITGAVNSLPYAYTWYLDAITPWDALVLNDYQAIMPLPVMRKLGIKCLYQPYYCQQLGFFYNTSLSPDCMSGFMDLVTRLFSYIHINLNPAAQPIATAYGFKHKKNLLLNLSHDYKKLSSRYSESHRRNIAKANKQGLIFTEDVQLKSFQKFYVANVDPTKEVFKAKHAKIFKALTEELITKNKAQIFAATGADKNPLAAVLLITHPGRLIGIINTSSVAGKQTGASAFVFDQIIRKYAGTDLILDFEGSSIPGIARFYEGFGGQEERFYNYKHNIMNRLGLGI